MRRTWVRVLAVGGATLLTVWVISLFLSGLEALSWAAGTGSFVLAAVALALAWTPPKSAVPGARLPAPVPAGAQVNNRVGDVYGTSIQAGTIHGSVTVHSPPTDVQIPGWVETALPVHQADASELGVHHALPGAEDAGPPPYVARDVDGELDQRLATVAAAPRGGLVLVTGASTAGKTRALVAALARTLPDRMLVAPPEDADLRPLPAWLEESSERAPQGWVVWLDDLDRHLSTSGLDPALVTELGQAGAVVAATIRRNQLEALRPSSTEHTSTSQGVGYAVLKAPPVVVERRWSPAERERARASEDERLVQAAADERFGVAEQLAAGPLLQQTLSDGPDSGHPRGYALVAAAVGLAQAGVSRPLTRDQLQSAHGTFLPVPPPLPEETDRAWEWATRTRSGLAGLLVPTDHNGLRWRAFDYLTLPGPLPEAVWQIALDVATDQDRFDIGITALRSDQTDITEAAWTPLAKRGHIKAMVNIGNLLKGTGRVEEGEGWYRKAADQGDHDAMLNLGHLLEKTGRAQEAEQWYRKAAESGHTGAMLNLGHLLVKTGRVQGAETWYQQGLAGGETEITVTLGHLSDKSWRVEEDDSEYRQAAESGHTGAMLNLGLLLEKTGRAQEAEQWYRKAAELGHTGAMNSLGALLAETMRVREAETWYRQAIDAGDIVAVLNLERLLEKTGRAQEAETWYRKAVELFETDPMFNLEDRLARVQEAEQWYRQAIAGGDTGAMTSLGNLLVETDRLEEAEQWYRQAAESGETDAMNNLGNLLSGTGRAQEAEQWWQRYLDAKEPE